MLWLCRLIRWLCYTRKDVYLKREYDRLKLR